MGQQAQRDGEAFQLPKLSTLCLNVISDHFDTHILPLEYAPRKEGGGKNEKGVSLANLGTGRSKGLLGFGYTGYDEEQDKDFMPSSDEEGRSIKKRKRPQTRKTKGGRFERELDEYRQERNAIDLEVLPPKLTLALQELLERKAPRTLTYDVLAEYFLSKPKVLSSHTFRVLAIVGGVPADDVVRLWKRLVVQSPDEISFAPPKIVRPNAATSLRSLHLQAFTRLSSRQLEPLLAEVQNLESICLRGCVNVTTDVVARLVQSCGQTLKSANFNWTSIGLTGVEHLICGAPNLEELKIAHVQGLTDATVPAMMTKATQATIDQGTVPLSKIRKIKLNGTQVGGASVGSLLKHCGPQLQSLDIGNTKIGGTGSIEMLLMALGYSIGHTLRPATKGNETLQKINLSRLELPEMDLLHFIRALPDFHALRTINLDHVQPLKGGSTSGLSANLLAFLFHNVALRALDARNVIGEPRIEYIFDKISVATNSITTRPLMPGLLEVAAASDDARPGQPARRIVRSLNLSGLDLSAQHRLTESASVRLPDGTMADLALHSDAIQPTPLASLNVEELNLAGCKLPEECPWPRLGASGRLRSVDLSGTSVSRASIDELIEANPFLERMDLTGCRSIPVRHRRNYFDVFEEERRA